MEPLLTRIWPELLVLMIVLAGQTAGALWILFRPPSVGRKTRIVIAAAACLSLTGMMLGFLLRFSRVARHVPSWAPGWGRAVLITWGMLSLMWLAALVAAQFVGRPREHHSPARRNFLRTARAAMFTAPPAVIGYGMFIQRNQMSVREEKIEIPGLPHDLDGLRLVQLTDIHLSPFLERSQLERAVAMANETRPHLAVVTGDLITTAADPLDDCLDALAGLRADAGVYGCLGNHEVYARSESYTELQGLRRGMRFLRGSAAPLRFGDANLNLAGVDYQNTHKPYLVEAERLIVPGALNVLLSHNPDVFPIAARQGYDLTISGHTHGGQIRVEILGADLDLARFYTPYYDGLYRQEHSSIFVSRGIGTIGVPVRLGAPPEVALLRLCRT